MKKIDKIFFMIFLLFQVNFFDFLDTKDSILQGLASYSQKKILVLFILVYLVVRPLFIEKKENKSYFKVFVGFTMFAWLAILFATVHIFHQGLLSTFFIGYYFLILLLYFPFSRFFVTWNVWDSVIRITAIFSVILSSTKIVQSFFLSFLHKNIFYLNNIDYDTAIQMKFMTLGFTRIASATDFVFVATAFLIMGIILDRQIFSSKVRTCLLLVNVFYIIVIGQTRLYIILMILILSLFLLKQFIKVNGSLLTASVITVIAIPFLFLIIMIMNKVLFSDSSRAIAFTIRLQAMQYYLDNIALNGWFSMGFARDDLFSTLIHGGSFLYNFDDVGMIGFVGRFGWLGVTSLAFFIVSLIMNFIRSLRKYTTFICIVILIGTSVSVSLLDPQRIFYLPLILAFMDFLTYQKISEGKNE